VSLSSFSVAFVVFFQYVDPNYEGGGISEYKIYNPSNGAYDTSSCSSSGRCAAMDCHDSSTETWQLMGIYKEAVYYGGDAFFEQLFKHEAYCVWNSEDAYEFMSDSREMWTQGCVDTGYTDQYDNIVYIDMKPGYNGNMQNSLYSDEICKTEYNGSDLDVDSVAYSLGLLSGDDLSLWNSYLEPFKVCQPCKAYNLGGSRRDLSNYNNGGSFQCDDDAGYTNVNQCMKFRAHGDLETASWEDLVIGTEQGGILEIKVGQTYFGTKYMTTSQAQYLQNLMTKKAEAAQQEEEEYTEMLNSIPSTTPIMLFGLSVLLLGTTALVGSIIWGVQQLDKEHEVVMEEPLILRKLAVYNAKSALRKGQRVLQKVGVNVNNNSSV
jgi:hypothetical protein